MQISKAGLALAWLLAIVSTAANVAGYAFHLYISFWWFDRVLHSSTLLSMTYWLGAIVFVRGLHLRHRTLGFLLIASVGVACGALWEVAEWAFNQMQPADLIKGKYDSIMDIIMDTIGALLGSALLQPFLRASNDLSGAQ